ncbi:MAG: HAD-IA family hydrolase [Phycisphaerales bacterium]|nr:HAD-IA family hydrolase [Phycisphaerales bacterium]
MSTVQPKAILIDLDLTMVDSTCAEPLRRARRWQDVYACIPEFVLYEGITSVLSWCRSEAVKVAVVTSSPRPYAERTLTHFGCTVDALVCYHDTKLHKPHPAPLLRALELLGCDPASAWSIGDNPKDIAAARSAQTLSGAALWGCVDRQVLLDSKPDFADESPAALLNRLRSGTL